MCLCDFRWILDRIPSASLKIQQVDSSKRGVLGGTSGTQYASVKVQWAGFRMSGFAEYLPIDICGLHILLDRPSSSYLQSTPLILKRWVSRTKSSSDF